MQINLTRFGKFRLKFVKKSLIKALSIELAQHVTLYVTQSEIYTKGQKKHLKGNVCQLALPRKGNLVTLPTCKSVCTEKRKNILQQLSIWISSVTESDRGSSFKF